MSEEETSKQALISSDAGINQETKPFEKTRATELFRLNVTDADKDKPIKLGGDANEGVSARFTEPSSPSFKPPAFRPTDPARPPGTRGPHPSFFRTPEGTLESYPVARESAQEAYELAEKYPDLDSYYMSNAGAFATGKRELLTQEDLQAADDPSMLENVAIAFEGFDAPRRLLWQGLAWGGQALPNPGSPGGDFAQDVLGFMGGWVLGGSAMLSEATVGATLHKEGWGAWSDLADIADMFDSDGDKESDFMPDLPGIEMVDGYMGMMENLYGSVATGELHEMATDHVRPWLWGDWSKARTLTGDMVLDAMISKEQAFLMSQDESLLPGKRAFARHISTDVGRLSYGVVAELIVDPLWLMGPAKSVGAASKIRKGEKIYDLHRSLSKASGSMERMAKGSNVQGHNNVIGDLFLGSADELEEASQIVTNYAEIATASRRYAEANLDTIETALRSSDDLRDLVRSQGELRVAQIRETAEAYISALGKEKGKAYSDGLIGVAEKQLVKAYKAAESREASVKWLTRETKRLNGEIRTFKNHSNNLRFAIRSSNEARAAGSYKTLIKERGFMSVHLPFTTKTGYLFKEGPLDKATALIDGSPVLSKIVDNYYLPNLEAKIAKFKEGARTSEKVPTETEILKDQPGAMLAYATQKAGVQAAMVPMVLWDLLAQALGTRHIQPLLVSMGREAYEKAGHLTAIPWRSGFLAKIKRVNPAVWENYQDAVTKLMNSYGGLEMKLRADIDRLTQLASKAQNWRKKNKGKKLSQLRRKLSAETDVLKRSELKQEIKRVELWGDSSRYTLNDVLLEAASGLESGAGAYAKLSDEVKAAGEEARALIQKILDDPNVQAGKLEVEQAIVALVREGRKDPEAYNKVAGMLEIVNAQMSNVSSFREVFKVRAQQALLNRVTQLRSLKEGIESIDSDDLVSLIEKAISLRKNGKLTGVEGAEHVYAFLKDITGSDIAARQVLRRLVIGMDASEAGTALAKLVERLTGSFEFAGNHAGVGLHKAVTIALNSFLTDLKAEHKVLREAFRKGGVLDEPLSVAGGQYSFMPGMDPASFRIMLKDMIQENDETWKILIPDNERADFLNWIDPNLRVVPPASPVNNIPKKPKRPAPKTLPTETKPRKPLVARESLEAIETFEKSGSGIVKTGPINYHSASALAKHLASSNVDSEYKGLLSIINQYVGDDVQIAFIKKSTNNDHAYVSDFILGGNAPGAFELSRDGARTIYINMDSNPSKVMEAVTHEILHSATVNRYRTMVSKFNLGGGKGGALTDEALAAGDIQKLFNHVVDISNKHKDGGLLSQHMLDTLNAALKSPEEMISWGLTNKSFFQYLNDIEFSSPARLSVFEVLLAKIKALFVGARADTAASSLARSVEALLHLGDDFVPLRKSEHELFSMAKTVENIDDVKQSVFNFEPSNNPAWNQARTYYERSRQLRKVKRATSSGLGDPRNLRRQQSQVHFIKPAMTYSEHEGYRLADILQDQGFAISKKNQVTETHPWYFTEGRAKVTPEPTVKGAADATKATKAVTPKEETVTKETVTKDTTTETAPSSHEATPPVGSEPLVGQSSRKNGVLSKDGIYRTRWGTPREFRVLSQKDRKNFKVVEIVDDKSIPAFDDKIFVGRQKAAEAIKDLDEASKPTHLETVTISAGDILRRTVEVTDPVKGSVRRSRNYWTDRGTGITWWFGATGKGKNTEWRVYSDPDLTKEVYALLPEHVGRGVTKDDIGKAYADHINITTRHGNLGDTDAAIDAARAAASGLNDANGTMFDDVFVQLNPTTTAKGSYFSLDELGRSGFKAVPDKYNPKVGDALVVVDKSGADQSDFYAIAYVDKNGDATIVDSMGKTLSPDVETAVGNAFLNKELVFKRDAITFKGDKPPPPTVTVSQKGPAGKLTVVTPPEPPKTLSSDLFRTPPAKEPFTIKPEIRGKKHSGMQPLAVLDDSHRSIDLKVGDHFAIYMHHPDRISGKKKTPKLTLSLGGVVESILDDSHRSIDLTTYIIRKSDGSTMPVEADYIRNKFYDIIPELPLEDVRFLYVKKPATTRLGETIKVAKNKEDAVANGFKPNVNEKTGAVMPVPDGSTIAIFDGDKYIGGGLIKSRIGNDHKLHDGTLIDQEKLKALMQGEDQTLTVLIKRPVVKKRGPEDLAAAGKEKFLRPDAAREPLSQEELLDLSRLKPEQLTREVGEDSIKMLASLILERSRRLNFSYKNQPLKKYKETYNTHTKNSLMANKDDLAGVDSPTVILRSLSEVNSELLGGVVEPWLVSDIIELLSDLRTSLGVDQVVGRTVLRAFFADKSWKKATTGLLLKDVSSKVGQEVSLLAKRELVTDAHLDLLRLEEALWSGDIKKIDRALAKAEDTFIDPDAANMRLWMSPVSRDKPIILDSEWLNNIRVREAMKGANDEDVANSIMHIISRKNTVDPVVKSVLLKALKKRSSKLLAAFTKVDPQKEIALLNKELSVLKESLIDYIRTPDAPLPAPKDVTKFIKPIVKEGGERTDTALADLFTKENWKEYRRVRGTNLEMKRLEEKKARIMKEMDEVRPHLGEHPDSLKGKKDETSSYREISDWESKLWAGWKEISQRHGLSKKDELKAAFTVLREAPQFLTKTDFPELAKQYPSLIGRRFGDADDELVPVMEELESLISRYEVEYKKRGYEWTADPERIMRDWGVLEYVPHLYKEVDTQVMREVLLGKVFHGHGKGTDQILWVGKTAKEQRTLAGSILELKAAINADTDKVLTLDPIELWGRYSQVNRSMTNEDFLITLMNTGVVIPISPRVLEDGRVLSIEQQARDLDMIPLFSRPDTARSQDLIQRGNLEEWLANGLNSDDVLELIASKGQAGTDLFATWLTSSPKMRSLQKTEQAVLRVRAQQFRQGQELFNPSKMFEDRIGPIMRQEADEWDNVRGPAMGLDEDIDAVRARELAERRDELSKPIWDEIAKELNALAKEHAVTAPSLAGKHLEHYYGGSHLLWEMYIPRGVVQNMKDTLEMGSEGAGVVGRMAANMNAWWKTRVTVTSVAFSTRNAISNTVSNILDLGVFGALNPRTNKLAVQLSSALMIKEEYGSVRAFIDLVDSGGIKLPSIQKGRLKLGGLRELSENGVDFRNGIVMPLDEVLDDMIDTNVVSPAFTQFSDITAAERNALQALSEGGSIRRALSKKHGKDFFGGIDIEDAIVVAISTAISGGIPVALPKNMGGKYLARIVENQARAANFLGNFKKTGVWSDAAAHANKFLFDYGDLTKMQRQTMRLIFPFFTWNLKNVHLQMEMMHKSPAFYATFHRLMSDGVPQVFEASQHDQGTYIKSNPLDMDNLRLRETHYMHTIGLPFPSLEGTTLGKLPVPVVDREYVGGGKLGAKKLRLGTLEENFPTLKNAKIQGLGLPQEGFINTMSEVGAFLDPRNYGWGVHLPNDWGGKTARARAYSDRHRKARLLGEVHFMLRYAFEEMFGRHVFYDKDINELTDGRLVSEVFRPLGAVPLVGEPLKSFMQNRAGMNTYSYYDKFNRRWRTKIHIDGKANFWYGSLPWMRNFRDAAAATEMFFASHTVPVEQLLDGRVKASELKGVPFAYTIADAMSGANIKQLDPEMMRAFSEHRLKKMRLKQLEAEGIIKPFKQFYIPYK